MRSEDDLYLQVGKTIDRRPIDESILRQMVAAIESELQLDAKDHLLDLCCGNGLLSFHLANTANKVTAIDFSAHLIQAARQFKSRPNIDYHVGDALKAIDQLLRADTTATKVLMNDSLAYFDPFGLDRLLGNLRDYFGERGFRFLMTGIPSFELHEHFYDTPERKARFEEHQARADDTNDGMGRWWRRAEIEDIARKYGMHVEIRDQPWPISKYRMNALVIGTRR